MGIIKTIHLLPTSTPSADSIPYRTQQHSAWWSSVECLLLPNTMRAAGFSILLFPRRLVRGDSSWSDSSSPSTSRTPPAYHLAAADATKWIPPSIQSYVPQPTTTPFSTSQTSLCPMMWPVAASATISYFEGYITYSDDRVVIATISELPLHCLLITSRHNGEFWCSGTTQLDKAML